MTFTCVAISSPSFTIINWLHRGRLIDNGDRYNISSAGNRREAGAAVSVSTLSIDDVNGFDSGPVECRATYSYADNSQSTFIASETVLGVLGK